MPAKLKSIVGLVGAGLVTTTAMAQATNPKFDEVDDRLFGTSAAIGAMFKKTSVPIDAARMESTTNLALGDLARTAQAKKPAGYITDAFEMSPKNTKGLHRVFMAASANPNNPLFACYAVKYEDGPSKVQDAFSVGPKGEFAFIAIPASQTTCKQVLNSLIEGQSQANAGGGYGSVSMNAPVATPATLVARTAAPAPAMRAAP